MPLQLCLLKLFFAKAKTQDAEIQDYLNIAQGFPRTNFDPHTAWCSMIFKRASPIFLETKEIQWSLSIRDYLDIATISPVMTRYESHNAWGPCSSQIMPNFAHDAKNPVCFSTKPHIHMFFMVLCTAAKGFLLCHPIVPGWDHSPIAPFPHQDLWEISDSRKVLGRVYLPPTLGNYPGFCIFSG